MEVYNIYKDGELINTIVADETFCEKYCAKNGYTYELAERKAEPEPEIEENTIWDELDAAYQEGVDSI